MRRHPELAHQGIGAGLERLIAAAEATMGAELGQQQVLLDRQVGHDVLRPPVLRHEAYAGPNGGAGTMPLQRLAADLDDPRIVRTQAEDRLERL